MRPALVLLAAAATGLALPGLVLAYGRAVMETVWSGALALCF